MDNGNPKQVPGEEQYNTCCKRFYFYGEHSAKCKELNEKKEELISNP